MLLLRNTLKHCRFFNNPLSIFVFNKIKIIKNIKLLKTNLNAKSPSEKVYILNINKHQHPPNALILPCT